MTARGGLLTFPGSAHPAYRGRHALSPVRASRIDCAMFPRSARSHRSRRYRLLTRAGRRDPPGWEHDEHRSRVPVAAETAPAHWSIPNLKARHRATPRRRPSVRLAADRRVATRSATGLVLRVRTRARRTLHLDAALSPRENKCINRERKYTPPLASSVHPLGNFSARGYRSGACYIIDIHINM